MFFYVFHLIIPFLHKDPNGYKEFWLGLIYILPHLYEMEDIEEHNEDMEDIDMESDKEGTYYRKWKTWNQGDLRKGSSN